MRSSFVTRIRFLSIIILAAALILVAKLYYVQVIQGNEFSARADRQYVKPNQNIYNRGNIYFETKEGAYIGAATLKEGFTLVMHPKLLTEPDKAYARVSKIVTLDKDMFFSKAAKKEDPYEELSKRVDMASGEKIQALGIPGIRVYKEKWRSYPGGSLASNTLGIVGFQGDTLAGRYGLEKYYDGVLKRDSNTLYTNFFAEIFSGLHKRLLKSDELSGNLVMTIEPSVQNYLEKMIKKVQADRRSELTGGIVINPKNGEIYAMAVTPSFDPNDLRDVKDPKVFSNPLVESVYEMGSIIKPLTMAAALDTGAITAETTYEDTGSLTLNGKKISNFDGKARGTINMQSVLNNSLNVGMTFVALKMGKEEHTKYMYNFGLGDKTGIDLPDEAKNLVDNLKSNRDIEHATASYGQGIAMTPISTVRALSALGNGGYLITPHIVKKIDYELEPSKDISYGKGTQVISKEASNEITRMLIEVVDRALAQGTVAFKNHSIAAKTGTAQIANPHGGGYYTDRYLHSFFGYFPAYNPEFLVFFYTVNPKGVEYASASLTTPFVDMSKFLINYYEIQPDR